MTKLTWLNPISSAFAHLMHRALTCIHKLGNRSKSHLYSENFKEKCIYVARWQIFCNSNNVDKKNATKLSNLLLFAKSFNICHLKWNCSIFFKQTFCEEYCFTKSAKTSAIVISCWLFWALDSCSWFRFIKIWQGNQWKTNALIW